MALFQKGHPPLKGAGRPPGSPNRKKYRKASEVLEALGFNPIEEILAILKADDEVRHKDPEAGMSPNARIQVWLELLAYCQGKPKEVEAPQTESDEELLEKLEGVTDETLLSLVKSPGT